MIEQRRNWLFYTGQVMALVLLAMLGFIDVSYGLFRGAHATDTGPIQVLLALATTALWLPAHRQGSRSLPVLAMLLAGGSIVITGLLWLLNSGDGASWGLAEVVGMLLGLLTVARRASAPLAVPAATLILLAVTVQPARSGITERVLTFGLFQALCGAAVLGAGGYLRFLAVTRERQVAMVAAEQRAQFARDLHDFVAHHVTGIVVQAQGARFIAEQDPQRVISALEQIERAGGETMAAMRRMVSMLRGQGGETPTAPLAGTKDLPELIEGFRSSGGPPTRLHVVGRLDGLPVEVASTAYRVVMEALTNIRRHATGASEVDVWIRRTPTLLLLRISDNAAPARPVLPREPAGFGLIGLAERLAAIGGRLHAGPGVGRGWVVDATLPLESEGPR